LAGAQARALSRLGVGLLAVVAACAVADAKACTRRAATEIAAFGCEPYARVVWIPAATRGSLGGTPFALGLARLNRAGVQMTGHDPDEAAVVPVVSLRPSREVGVAVMPTLRDGEVGAAVIVSLRVGR
jgi:hypothetical protein